MMLTPGTRLGPYEIVTPIGAGGMGEVYKGRDTRLGRMVAIKVAQERFSERFAREARAVAALNHPNICQLYDVGPDYLVMEFVEGESPRGPLPHRDAIPVIGQFIDAIEAAHEKGIVHRDLKPANLKITPEGRLKVLDFGLAKAAEPEPTDSPENSPTLTMSATRAGIILGTAAYMAPEQARGKATDRRSDIWSFGVVVYELLTGRQLFHGEGTNDLLAAVIKEEPNLGAAPAQFRRLLGACLRKDPQKRLQAIADARLLLTETPAEATVTTTRRVFSIPSIALAVLALVAVAGWIQARRRAAAGPEPDLTLSIVPSHGQELAPVGGLNVDRISPDGSSVLFRSNGGFRLRKLSSLDLQPLPALNYTGDPFWSPDSQSVVVPTVSGLVKIHLPNGAPEFITAEPIGGERGGTWSQDGMILFAMLDSSLGGVSLFGVPAAGGQTFRLEVPGLGKGRYYNPEFLTGGDDFLFAFVPPDSSEALIYLATLREQKAVNPQLLFKNDTPAAFTRAGGGRILFVRNDNLYAQKLDPQKHRISGDPELIQQHVVSNPIERNANFSVSTSGTLAWRSGTAVLSQAIVFDRRGDRVGVAGPPVPVGSVRLSPDEEHLLATSEAGAWVVEANGPGLSPLSLAGGVVKLWSPDGSRVITNRGRTIVGHPIDGSGEDRSLAELPASGALPVLNEVLADGGILYGDQKGLFLARLDGKRPPERIADQRIDNAAISLDGTWVVYHPFTESGIYVQLLRNGGFRRQIAAAGNFPVWRKDGKEILYYDQQRIWSVRVEGSSNQPRFAPPEALFPVARPMGLNSGSRPLAVNHDGSRIYFLQSTEQPDAGVINVRTGAVR